MNKQEHIQKTAESSEGMNNADTATFHFFNPNGLKAAWQANCQVIQDMVESGKLDSSTLFSHGSLAHFHVDLLGGIACQSRLNSYKLESTILGLKNQIKKQRELIALNKAG